MKYKKTKELLIIIPTYNEEKHINQLLDQLEKPEIASIADILVMDDGSTDGTNWIVKSRNHALVTHIFNLGYGGALQLGYKYAIRRGYKYVIQMDADGQHDPCNVPLLYHYLKTEDENGHCPDIVLGSRFLKGGESFYLSPIKRFAIGLFRKVIKWATKKDITDPTTGLQGLSKRAVLYYSRYLHFDNQYPDANMIMQMLLLGFRVEEVPAIMHARETGVSMHSGLKPIIYMLHMAYSLLAVWIRIKVLKKDLGAVNDILLS
ncbi:MAG: glycosyltransferase family 2 protein [Lachnospiraceae bacterium]|nr:glycosyltransferase family 2 protein [Lachnospiraceae bacterium]